MEYKTLNNGIKIQWIGIIIPIRKYVITAPDILKRSLPSAKLAIQPMIILRINAVTHTIAEFKVAIPSFPAVHAKIKFPSWISSGNANGLLKISVFVFSETKNIHTNGAK